uniref:OSJNBa0011J08.18 protein n=1 Tax=Oryza sativa subsp. japonica TaxID=39947 RepID=Q7XQ71_ORYSJ|nr:OSJNBa0011J08.18 [Oryza sativa Japonica Group]
MATIYSWVHTGLPTKCRSREAINTCPSSVL